jgi:hypothetical protein
MGLKLKVLRSPSPSSKEIRRTLTEEDPRKEDMTTEGQEAAEGLEATMFVITAVNMDIGK